MMLTRVTALKSGSAVMIALLSYGCFQGILDLAESDGSLAFEAQAAFSQEVLLDAQTSVRVEGINGTVHIRGVEDGEVMTVEAVRRVKADARSDAEEHLDLLNVFLWSDQAEVLVQTVHPEETGQRSYEVDYRITLPRHLEVTIINSNGSVRINGIAADTWVENLNGDVALRGISGSAWVELANGVVDTDITLPPGHVLVHKVGNGGTRVRVQEGVSAEFTASVGNGTIDVIGLELQRVASSGKTLEGVLGSGEGIVHLDVGNGWVEVMGR